MRVEDVMSTDVEFIEASATTREAAELMGELEVGALPVGSVDGVEGIVTDRDILYRLVARGLDPSTVPVREVASRPVIFCRATDTLQAAMDLMAANHIRRMPVRSEAGGIVGWLTLADLARKLLVDGTALQNSLRALTEAEDGARETA